jgi:hypothetical protein
VARRASCTLCSPGLEQRCDNRRIPWRPLSGREVSLSEGAPPRVEASCTEQATWRKKETRPRGREGFPLGGGKWWWDVLLPQSAEPASGRPREHRDGLTTDAVQPAPVDARHACRAGRSRRGSQRQHVGPFGWSTPELGSALLAVGGGQWRPLTVTDWRTGVTQHEVPQACISGASSRCKARTYRLVKKGWLGCSTLFHGARFAHPFFFT